MTVTVAAAGDSLTRSFPDVDGWVRRACDELGLPLVAEVAEVGARARRIRTEFLPAALAGSPEVCVVLAGANDVARGRVPWIELLRIWRGVRRTGARLIVATLPPKERGPRTQVAQLATNAFIRLAARLGGWSLVELTGPLGGRRWRPELRRDEGHPNAAGKQRMAELLAPVLRREADLWTAVRRTHPHAQGPV